MRITGAFRGAKKGAAAYSAEVAFSYEGWKPRPYQSKLRERKFYFRLTFTYRMEVPSNFMLSPFSRM